MTPTTRTNTDHHRRFNFFAHFTHTQACDIIFTQTVFAAATIVAVEDAKRVVLASTTAPFGVPDNHLETEVTARLPDPLFID